MTLEVEGVPILTHPDFNALIRGLDDYDGPGLEPIAAWFQYQPVQPEVLHACFDITCRVLVKADAEGEAARRVIDAACERLEAAFPERLSFR